MKALTEARTALLAASAHTPAGSNAAALIAAAVAEIDRELQALQAPATP